MLLEVHLAISILNFYQPDNFLFIKCMSVSNMCNKECFTLVDQLYICTQLMKFKCRQLFLLYSNKGLCFVIKLLRQVTSISYSFWGKLF